MISLAEVLNILISSVTATFITALIAVAGYFYRMREKRQSAYKQLLYNLLVMWDEVASIYYADIETLLKRVMTDVQKHFPEAIGNDGQLINSPSEVELYQDMLRRVVQFAVDRKRSASLTERYASALQEVSRSDPVMAWRLEGKEYTKDLLSKVDDSASAFSSELLKRAPDSDERKQEYARTLDELVSKREMNNLEDQILEVADRAGEKERVVALMEKVKSKRSGKSPPDEFSSFMEKLSNDFRPAPDNAKDEDDSH